VPLVEGHVDSLERSVVPILERWVEGWGGSWV
jgi:hypothetical protein